MNKLVFVTVLGLLLSANAAAQPANEVFWRELQKLCGKAFAGSIAADTSAAEIEQEMSRTRQQLAGEKDLSVRVSVRQSLALAERRLSQWEHIGNTRRAVEVQLDTLEKSFSYLRSRAMTSDRAVDVSQDIDALLSQTSSVTAVEAETQDGLRY